MAECTRYEGDDIKDFLEKLFISVRCKDTSVTIEKLDIPPPGYTSICMDCEATFKPRKGEFGNTFCSECFGVFGPSEQRKDIKPEFEKKDITVTKPFLCGRCNCIVHEENGMCDKCKSTTCDEDPECECEYEDYEDGYDMWDDIQSQCPPEGCEFCSRPFSGFNRCVCDDNEY